MVMVTQMGVQFYRWQRMGVNDLDDLVWLAEFYCNQIGWNVNLVGAALQETKRYYRK